MKNLIHIFVLLFCFCTLGNAQQWIDQVFEVDTIKDVTYGSAVNFNNNSVDLHVDIYLPKCQDTTTKRPLMMVVHGGGFIIGERADVKSTCVEFARRGYVTVNVEYRLGYINDDYEHNCTLNSDFPCLFAADTMEWYRAYYRGIQDVKGAMRYMVNRKDFYHIDEQNVFLTGESAGAFLAMGATYMDDPAERPTATFAISDANVPYQNAQDTCDHNDNETFSGSILRPDLGGIDGTIEPALYPFTIRAVGNMYGGMFQDLLTLDNSVTKPALYSFHQKCDIIVPWDSKRVYFGLGWCSANCISCTYIYNAPIVHGSKTLDEWNTNQNLGYDILSEFVTSSFPYDCGNPFFTVPQSCEDQLLNPCHAFDNKSTRMTNMATFFASKMVNPDVCAPFNSVISLENNGLLIYPNPVEDLLNVKSDERIETIRILDLTGSVIQEFQVNDFIFQSSLTNLSGGIYMIECTFENKRKQEVIIRK